VVSYVVLVLLIAPESAPAPASVAVSEIVSDLVFVSQHLVSAVVIAVERWDCIAAGYCLVTYVVGVWNAQRMLVAALAELLVVLELMR